jgi:hypothetical protein
MNPFNALSTAVAVRMIPLLREAPAPKVASCALVASTDLEKALGATKEVIGGANAPSAMMCGRPAKSPGRLATISGGFTPLEVGQPPSACQCSPAAQGHGSHPVCALSPHLTIGKEHHSITPTRLLGCPHPEEDNHSTLASGSVKQ